MDNTHPATPGILRNRLKALSVSAAGAGPQQR
jgi:hypothetical protein